jgi:hypothetical protein
MVTLPNNSGTFTFFYGYFECLNMCTSVIFFISRSGPSMLIHTKIYGGTKVKPLVLFGVPRYNQYLKP